MIRSQVTASTPAVSLLTRTGLCFRSAMGSALRRDDFPPASARRLSKTPVFAAVRCQRGNRRFSAVSQVWWRMSGSNRRPLACKASALPAELIPRIHFCFRLKRMAVPWQVAISIRLLTSLVSISIPMTAFAPSLAALIAMSRSASSVAVFNELS